MKEKVLIINGPNLNLLGTREPEIYGSETLEDVLVIIRDIFKNNGIESLDFQSNHEGAIIDFLHQNRDADYIMINPGGLTHTSVALRDALAGIAVPFVEVHISNVHAREKFRQHSYLSDIANCVITGCGTYGYQLVANFIIQEIRQH